MPLPGWDNGNNQAAATLVSAGNNLRNYLYQQAVQKPAIQAQTAQTTAQTQALQQQTGMKGLELPSLQQQAVIATHPGISKNTLESTQPGSAGASDAQVNPPTAGTLTPGQSPGQQGQSTDTPTDAATPDSSISSTTTASDTGAMGANSSGGQPGSISSPTAAIRPPVSGVGPGTGNSAGVPQAPQFQLSQDDVDKLSANGIRVKPPGTFDLSTVRTPKSPAGTSVAGAAPQTGTPATPPSTGMSTTPSLTPPVSPAASVTTPEKPFDLRQHLGDDIGSYPQWKQDQILADLRQPFIDKKVPVPSDAFLTQYYRDQQSAYYPTATQRAAAGGFTPISGEFGPQGATIKGVFPGTDGSSEGGASGPSMWVRNPTTGESVLNPDYTAAAASTTPGSVAETREAANAIAQLRQKIVEARAAMARTNGKTTAVTGGGNLVQDVRHGVRTGESALSSVTGDTIGTTTPAQDEATLGLFTSGQFLEGVKGLKGIGRMDVPVVEGVKGGILTAGQPPETWEKYLDVTDKALAAKQAIVNEELAKQTRGTKTALPQVDITGQKVNMVKNADGTYSASGQAAPAQNNIAPGLYPTIESRAHLPSGTKFQVAPGQWRRKN